MVFKKISTILIGGTIIVFAFLYFRYQVYYFRGKIAEPVVFEIKKGEGNVEIASQLEKKDLIKGKIYFYYYVKTHPDIISNILPGVYRISGSSTIPEIAHIITSKQENFVKITFPEGWDAREMGERLTENGLPGKDFLKLTASPQQFSDKYSFLRDVKITTLEGYLFPDTYYFKQDASAEEVIDKILLNFSQKITIQMMEEIEKKGDDLRQAIILASLVEKEMATESDAKIVAGIFRNRLEKDMLLQSDAPLTYILDDKEDQHSKKDLELDSPYNTYKYKGLPPTPIANPGLAAILAVVYPVKTDYWYFLTVTQDGNRKTIFSKTFDEHVANRQRYGI